MESNRHEWQILHRDHERYEQFALVIKLFAVAIVLSCWVFAVDALLTAIFMLVLWLQEGIWRTYQARIGAQLLRVEKIVRESANTAISPYQLYSTWAAQRNTGTALFSEYFSNAVRPTVAYPYAVLILLTVGATLFSSAPF